MRFEQRLDEMRAILHPQTVDQRNVRNVLFDGIGVGISSGIAVFLPVFLARLNASSLLIGLITSLPALAGALLALPFGRFLERQANIVPWYGNLRGYVLSSYAVFGLLPFFLPLDLVPWAVIAIWALVTVPVTMVNVAFTVVMGEVAGPRRRFALMSMRWSSIGAVMALVVAIVGPLLDRIVFPLNYQVIFIASTIGGLLSLVFASTIQLPLRTIAPAPPQPKQRGFSLGTIVETMRTAPPLFRNYAGATFVFRCGVAAALPLLPIYYVREVAASDAWIGIINTVGNGVLLVAYSLWSMAAPRFGNRNVLLASSFGMALAPLLVAFTDSYLLLALLAGMASAFGAGNELVNFDLLLSTVPADRKATYVGIFQTLQNAALFVMPLVATAVADTLGLTVALIGAAVLRLLGAVLYTRLRFDGLTAEAAAG
jgi:MFS family permease